MCYMFDLEALVSNALDNEYVLEDVPCDGPTNTTLWKINGYGIFITLFISIKMFFGIDSIV